MSLFDSQDHGFKATLHSAMLVLAMEMGAYNVIVWRRRGKIRHLLSALVYVSLCVFEGGHIWHHAHAVPRRDASSRPLEDEWPFRR